MSDYYLNKLEQQLSVDSEIDACIEVSDICPQCHNMVLTDNFCTECGQFAISEKSPLPNLQSSINETITSTTGMIEDWGEGLEARLETRGIIFEDSHYNSRGTFHYNLLALVTLLAIFNIIIIFGHFFSNYYYYSFRVPVALLVLRDLGVVAVLGYYLYRFFTSKLRSYTLLIVSVGLFVGTVLSIIFGFYSYFWSFANAETVSSLIILCLLLSALFISEEKFVSLREKMSPIFNSVKSSESQAMSVDDTSMNGMDKTRRVTQKSIPEEQMDYNVADNKFTYRKRTSSTVMNIILYLILFAPLAFLGYYFGVQFDLDLAPAMAIVAVVEYIYLLPTFISKTNRKFIIFIFNAFFGITILGWIILLIIALNGNEKDKRNQEISYLMRKMSEK